MGAAALTFLLLVLPLAFGQPDPNRARSASLLAVVAPQVVADFDAGVIEARGTSDLIEQRPAINAARQARVAAIGRLRSALPSLHLSDGHTVSDLPPERLETILGQALRAHIVAEWYRDDGRVEAVASLPLYGDGSLLAMALGVAELPQHRPARAPLPALIVRLPADGPGPRPSLVPAVWGPDGAPLFEDPDEAARRGGRPVTYAESVDDALETMADGQSAVVVDGSVIGEQAHDVLLPLEALSALDRAHLTPIYACIDRVVLLSPRAREGD
jgi:hypothetical protein